MAINKLKLAGLILVLLISGCIRKDELTRPVRVNLNIGIAPGEASSRPEYFYFNWAHIGISRIEFTGKREAGGDVFFETSDSPGNQAIEFSEGKELLTSLDLPQGIYNPMRWDIHLRGMATSGLIGYDAQGSGLVVWAIYEYPDGSVIPVFLCIDDSEIFSFKTYGPDLDSEIALSESQTFNVILQFDLYSAFWPVSRESIESAENSVDLYGKPVIIISSSKNKALYQNLLFRISLSARALVC